jgi:PAS domain S-box-containing protein
MTRFAHLLKRHIIHPLEKIQGKSEVSATAGQVEQAPPRLNDRERNPQDHQELKSTTEFAQSSRSGKVTWAEAELEDVRVYICQLCQTDFAGVVIHERTHIVGANQGIRTIFGYDSPELATKTFLDLLSPESRSTVLRNTLIGYENPYQVTGLKKSGLVLPIEIFNISITHHGQTIKVMAVREITERTSAEVLRDLQQARQALEATVKESTQELRYANERLRVELNERKRAEAELIRRNHELTILQSASFAIMSSLDLRYILDTLTYELTKLLGVESCVIFEWKQAENTITLVAGYDSEGWWDPKSPPRVYDLANYPLKESVLQDQIPEQMTVSQAHIDPAESAYLRETNLKTQLLVPMIFQKQVIGLVELGDRQVERDFTYQEIALVKLLVSQAAGAVENARLYKQAQQEIAERKRAEAALEQERALLAERVRERTAELSKANIELARAARLKDEFLASMSHELRTPLNTILGSSEILQLEVFGALNEKQLKYVRNMEESGSHLLALINDILDLSKIEAGKTELEIASVAVKDICEASLRLIKELAHKKHLQVSFKLDENVTIVSADERRLKQILVNLLSNAVKFTPEGGQIGLGVVGDAIQHVVQFIVWDTGIGIAQDDMARLFQPFVQIDSSLSRQYNGTGLGLSLVARMVEMHGGGVSVESEVGQGSRFTVTLPCPDIVTTTGSVEAIRSMSAGQPSTEVTEDQINRPPLILLAEDNENIADMISDYLKALGYRMIHARNGEEALKQAETEQPHLILMDIQMPGMDGLEATRRLKSDANLARIPVVAITALAMPGDRERCRQAGADEYVSKPINLRDLVDRIEAQLH